MGLRGIYEEREDTLSYLPHDSMAKNITVGLIHKHLSLSFQSGYMHSYQPKENVSNTRKQLASPYNHERSGWMRQ